MENYSFERLKNNYDSIVNSIKEFTKDRNIQREIKIVAVSKTHPTEAILNAMECGIEHFGENYVQELKAKFEEIQQIGKEQPKWHFIGHLQTNKVKYIVPFVSLIHSVDSVHLAEEIDKQSRKVGRVTDVLIQVNTSGERSKFGCSPESLLNIVESIQHFENIRICGLMTIGSFSSDEKIIREEFRLLRNLFEQSKEKFPNLPLKELSMGMTNDYIIAIEEGATIVRIGTAIFGERHYNTF
jgi:pyridoxal phosphate enzyme (YggS family)